MKNICITGTNRGIGLALATEYSKDNNVFALCRHSSKELDGLPNTSVITDIDMNNSTSRHKAIEGMEEIDILILSAGILIDNQEDITAHETTIMEQIQTNAISPLIFAKMALPTLNKDAKIMLMTSRMGSQADNLSGGLDGYRMSKAALNTAGCNLAHELHDQGIAVFMIHPGYIKTDMTNHTGRNTTEEAATNIVKLLEKLTMENTGQFWHANAHQLPW
jgi:NAD(P)-dependent dehydrogenase (short-subunit alcohol dehydrogenase family)